MTTLVQAEKEVARLKRLLGEAEAVPAKRTRATVRVAIERHLDMGEVAVLEAAEKSERRDLLTLANEMVA